jgi:hypothetical protein
MNRIDANSGGRLLGAVAVLGLLAAPAWAGAVTRLANGQVNVKADRVPLKQLLEELAAVTPIPNLVIEPKLEAQSVTAYLEGESVPEAIRKTLEESGVQFMLWGGGDEPLGLYVGDLSKAGLRSGPAARPTMADLAAMSHEDRLALREQIRAERAESLAADAPRVEPESGPPADSFEKMAAAAAASAGAAADGRGAAVAGGGGVPGEPVPVHGTASWVGADGATHTTGYTIQGETVIYDDPNFVSFKNSPEAKARRMNMDVTTLP